MMKWVRIVFAFVLMMATFNEHCDKQSGFSDADSLLHGPSDNGRKLVAPGGPVCYPGDPCGLGGKGTAASQTIVAS